MAKQRNPFPCSIDVVLDLDGSDRTSVVPRFARDLGGYGKVIEAPDILELSAAQDGGGR